MKEIRPEPARSRYRGHGLCADSWFAVQGSLSLLLCSIQDQQPRVGTAHSDHQSRKSTIEQFGGAFSQLRFPLPKKLYHVSSWPKTRWHTLLVIGDTLFMFLCRNLNHCLNCSLLLVTLSFGNWSCLEWGGCPLQSPCYLLHFPFAPVQDPAKARIMPGVGNTHL